MKIRQKPIDLDAVQWWPPGDERHDPAMVSHRKGNSVSPPDYLQRGDIYCFGEGFGPEFGGNIFMIRTGGTNDNIVLKPGDWIINGVNGDKHICSQEAFEATYEPA